MTAIVVLGAAGGYLTAARSGRRSWPRNRTASWLAGLAALLVGTAGPLTGAGHDSPGAGFTTHAVSHVLVGMLAPLLLVCGAPVTLALRTLRVEQARRLSRVLSAPPLRWGVEPLVAATLSTGGLLLLYLTPLYGLAQHDAVVHLAVHLHLVVAGCLLTASLVGPDPMPHRRAPLHRALVLVAAVAVHDILAKHLYAFPPAGVADAETGAMVMYYGGDAVELVVMVLLCRGWFATRPARRASPA